MLYTHDLRAMWDYTRAPLGCSPVRPNMPTPSSPRADTELAGSIGVETPAAAPRAQRVTQTEPTAPLADSADRSQLDLIPHAPERLLAEDEMRGWPQDHDVDADLLRDLLLRRLDDRDPDPRGLYLRGARVRAGSTSTSYIPRWRCNLRTACLRKGISAEQARQRG
jgi:hypothetical protein